MLIIEFQAKKSSLLGNPLAQRSGTVWSRLLEWRLLQKKMEASDECTAR